MQLTIYYQKEGAPPPSLGVLLKKLQESSRVVQASFLNFLYMTSTVQNALI